MAHPTRLHLYEEILLLALRDEKGTIAATWYAQALAGALLAELLLEGHLRLDGDTLRAATDGRDLEDELLREAFELVHDAKRPKKLKAWMSKVSGLKGLKHRAAEGLCARGILEEDRRKVLLFFETRRYPELDHRPEAQVVARLEPLLHQHPRVEDDPRSVVLLSIAHHTELLPLVFDKKLLKQRKPHIQRVIAGEHLGQAAKALVEELQAAIVVAAIVPTIAG